MAPLKFCANVSWIFAELPDLSRRIQAAAAAGFQAVEAAWILDSNLQELQRVKESAGVELVLLNTPPGDLKAGDLGLGAVPGREAEFRRGLDQTVDFAKALNCKRIHLMAGRIPAGSSRASAAREMEAVFIQNLRYAADVLQKEEMTGLIEPINTRITDPTYFLDSPHQAAEILEKVGRPNIKLQMVSHVQVAQVPGRNEPDSPGELNFKYLFNTLENLDYQGYVGCEYKPLGSTEGGLGWIKEYWALGSEPGGSSLKL
uniref:Putative hydroxypyruvate isomerase n=1 Tax=Oryzias latipes TaxID=8090 RepID=A0A3P9KA79_ORYLA